VSTTASSGCSPRRPPPPPPTLEALGGGGGCAPKVGWTEALQLRVLLQRLLLTTAIVSPPSSTTPTGVGGEGWRSGVGGGNGPAHVEVLAGPGQRCCNFFCY
jgi:hypothetical protein